MLPLKHTRGRDTAGITLRTYGNAFARRVTAGSRYYYRACTHPRARLDVSDAPQADITPLTDTAHGPSQTSAGRRPRRRTRRKATG
ncbi:hypothetical protein K4749_23885 [Streptomyces sp. TRM72054]|uniref:hypothetical protein n=1 Tax=Streptomyces sp. TRM72054 TaxID=2870562 RepID=UPI001C8B0BA2|nr:hypothetical protein [Streptomyces sp. TRM72054]MBX9396546.1 hypothetical protein [Streptomyces sp. TRM72054]